MWVNANWVDSLYNEGESGGKLKGGFDEWNDDVCGWLGSSRRWCDQAVCREESCMCGNAESCCEGDLNVREVRSAVDAPCGIMVVACY